jgi:hypothetical protein
VATPTVPERGIKQARLNYFVQINLKENFAALVCFLIILSYLKLFVAYSKGKISIRILVSINLCFHFN